MPVAPRVVLCGVWPGKRLGGNPVLLETSGAWFGGGSATGVGGADGQDGAACTGGEGCWIVGEVTV